MRALQAHHIVDLYVWVAEALPDEPRPKGGRPPAIRDSELLTLLIWNALSNTCSRNLRQLYDWIALYHQNDVKALPTYGGFVVACGRVLPKLVTLVSLSLGSDTPLRFCDSTMLPVCKLQRSKQHRVAKAVAAYGYNHQGAHYGFKLHAAIDGRNRLVALVFTPADRYDGQILEQLVNEHTKVVVGDSHYGGSVAKKQLWKKFKTIIIAPPHHKQRRKLMAAWQARLLGLRSKIEATFDQLKEHLGLVSSFPRSIKGYFVHYLRVLLGYQMKGGF